MRLLLLLPTTAKRVSIALVQEARQQWGSEGFPLGMNPEGEVFPLGSLGMPVPSVRKALCLRHGCAVYAASGGGDTGMLVARLTQERQSPDKDCSALTHPSGVRRAHAWGAFASGVRLRLRQLRDYRETRKGALPHSNALPPNDQ